MGGRENNLWTNNVNSEPYKYGIGDNTNTFVIPNYMNRFIEGGNVLGIHNAGLPNITGLFFDLVTNVEGKIGNGRGVFSSLPQPESNTNTITIISGFKSTSSNDGISFDASRSSSVYGSSSTVQPNSIILIPQIRYK